MPKDFDAYLDDVSGGPVDPTAADASTDTQNTQVDEGANKDATFQPDKQPIAKAAPVQDNKDNKQEPQKEPTKQGQQPAQGTETPKPAQLRPIGGGRFFDEKGNIVDQQGKIIARAGAEARFHGDLNKAQRELQATNSQVKELTDKLATYSVLASYPQKYGITDQDMTMAMEMAAKVRQGKVIDVAKDIVALLASHGHNISELFGGDIGDSVEMKAMQRMLDERLAPLTEQNQQSKQVAETNRKATEAYQQFVDQNDYAELHGNEIAHIMQTHGISAQKAYNAVMEVVRVNNLDPSMPLDPQIAALSRQQQPTQQRQNPQPMPHGARTSGGGNAPSPAAMVANPDDSWDDILKRALSTQ